MKNRKPSIILVLAVLFTCHYIVGCGEEDIVKDNNETPDAIFLKATPPEGDLDANGSVTLTFNKDPGEVTVSAGTISGSNKTRIITGPFDTGHISLTAKWASDKKSVTLTYNILTPVPENLNPVNSVTFVSHWGIAAGSSDGYVRLWDIGNGKLISKWGNPLDNVKSIDYKSISIWDPAGAGHFGPAHVNTPVIAHGAYPYQSVEIWDIRTFKRIKKLPHLGSIRCVLFSPDSTSLACADAFGDVRLWNLKHMFGAWIGAEIIGSFTPLKLPGVISISYSSDGALFAGGSSDGTVLVWDVNADEVIKRLEHPSSVNSVSFGSDSALLAGGSRDGTVLVWDVDTGKVIKRLEHPSSVNSISFDPDSVLLASGSSDGIIRLWDIDTGENTKNLIGHTGSVRSIAFSYQNKILVLASGGSDGIVRLWDIDTGTLKSEFF